MNGNHKKFSIKQKIDTEENPFDRQQRISWWDQEKLKNAKVMVVGAGAIGNETLKNLALLGIGNIFIVDFDTISTSNLSRTVLFRQTDKGKNKSEIAAIRTKEMSLSENTQVCWFHGDAVWELGTGLFRSMDIVLGCLDNIETRFSINRQCWLANTPWIDTGIYELGMHVSVFVPPKPPCYQCATTKEQREAARKRYSCDDFMRSALNEGKMPTVQVTSSIASALQVQEAVKLLCGKPVQSGKKIYFQGTINDFDIIGLPKDNNCLGHATYPEIILISLDCFTTLREFLELIEQEKYSGKGAVLDFRADRTFVVSVACRSCGKTIEMYKPAFRIFDVDTICQNCRKHENIDNIFYEEQVSKQIVSEFSLNETESKLLNMLLLDLGIPSQHIVAVGDAKKNYRYYQLAEDNRFFHIV